MTRDEEVGKLYQQNAAALTYITFSANVLTIIISSLTHYKVVFILSLMSILLLLISMQTCGKFLCAYQDDGFSNLKYLLVNFPEDLSLYLTYATLIWLAFF
jgi:hypothetical protein